MALKKLRKSKNAEGICKLVINEDMTIYVIDELKDGIAKVIDTYDRYELNLKDVEEIDSAGIQLLLAMRNEIMRKEKEFRITAVSTSVTEFFENYGLSDRFNIGDAA